MKPWQQKRPTTGFEKARLDGQAGRCPRQEGRGEPLKGPPTAPVTDYPPAEERRRGLLGTLARAMSPDDIHVQRQWARWLVMVYDL